MVLTGRVPQSVDDVVDSSVSHRFIILPLTVVTASVDERLNEVGYIVPGLGDAGDRLYGSAGS